MLLGSPVHILPLISSRSLAFLIISMGKRQFIPFLFFGGMMMITRPDSTLWCFFHVWVNFAYVMRIICCLCLLLLYKRMLLVGFTRVFLINLLHPLQGSLRYFWGSGIMMETILNYSILNHSIRLIWNTFFLQENIIWKIMSFLVST